MRTQRYLASMARFQSREWELREGENVEIIKGTEVHLFSEILMTWQGIEGVIIDRAPEPVTIIRRPKEVTIMASSSVINDVCHIFNNTIIMN